LFSVLASGDSSTSVKLVQLFDDLVSSFRRPLSSETVEFVT
jgi:hypothetical protein